MKDPQQPAVFVDMLVTQSGAGTQQLNPLFPFIVEVKVRGGRHTIRSTQGDDAHPSLLFDEHKTPLDFPIEQN